MLMGLWLGQRYADFKDLMLARRVAKLVEQRKQIEQERREWEEVSETDAKGAPRIVGRRFSITKGGNTK